MDASIWLWPGVSYHLSYFFFVFFFCLVQVFFFWTLKVLKKECWGSVEMFRERFYATGLTTYMQSMNFMYKYWLYSSWTWKDGWEKMHPHRKLFISHDCHVQYRLYSNWTWKTGWKRMHPQALYFACIKIANVWPVGPYLCGQIASQNRPVMGTCSVW